MRRVRSGRFELSNETDQMDPGSSRRINCRTANRNPLSRFVVARRTGVRTACSDSVAPRCSRVSQRQATKRHEVLSRPTWATGLDPCMVVCGGQTADAGIQRYSSAIHRARNATDRVGERDSVGTHGAVRCGGNKPRQGIRQLISALSIWSQRNRTRRCRHSALP